ncbi:MAG: hypothetical protein AB7V32_03725, partial [Candidatus Berkiella sp.]
IKSYQQIVKHLLGSKSEPVDIDIIKDHLKNLFELRSYMPLPKDKVEERWQNFEQRYKAFQKTITDEKDWNKIENGIALKELTLDAAILSDMMFAVLEKELREEGKEVTTQTVSQALCDQNKSYNARFLQGAIVDLYNFARGNTHYEPDIDLFMRPNRPSETNQEYYENGIKNDVRKIYNTFIKKGFYQRYGNKAFKKELSTKDSRFEKLVQVDSAKVRYFRAYAG